MAASPNNPTGFVLVVEDERDHGEAIVEGLRRAGHAAKLVDTGEAAIESVRQRPPDVVLTDYKLGTGLDGMQVLTKVKEISPHTEVVLITAYGNEELAREALRSAGARAYDYITKPLDLDDIRETVDRAARQAISTRDNLLLREQLDRQFEFEGIIGGSEPMLRIVRRLRLVADSKITVLIVGESGVGKDMIAQAIHRNSPRRNKAYRVINCAGLNENLLESELFGHVRGAYTGAVTDRKGLFEAADGGTLFLDEVGDMPLPMQAKLLRALENGEVTPVGSNDTRHVDVRVIAATKQDLRRMVDKGEFRDDLYFRLNQVTINVPPLRERRADIPLLIHRFIEQANREHSKHVEGIDPDAVRKLVNYQWEGNVRQLKNAIDAMVVLATGPVLTVDDIPDPIRSTTDLVPASQSALAGMSLREIEKLAIQHTLRMTGNNRERAAKVLGIGARTLYRKLKEYGIN